MTAVQVDIDRREITGAIGEVAAPPRTGARGVGLVDQLRAELGREVHQRYRRERAASAGTGFASEVAVELIHRVDGYTARLRGRIDGLIDRGDRVTLEEVKSVTLGGSQLHRMTAAAVPDYCLQVSLYGLALAAVRPGVAIETRVLLHSVVDGGRATVPVEFDPGAIAVELDRRLRVLIAEAERRRRRARARRRAAAALVFPYPAPRPHQQALIDRLAAGLAAGRPVLATAPTGIGKTVSALQAGLRFALAGDHTLYFVTAKTTQQELVARTARDLFAAAGLRGDAVTAITLRAKERMCPPGDLLCHPDLCPYLADFPRRLAGSGILDQLAAEGPHLDGDRIYARGEAARLCPFELSLELAARAELVICDYNYVYDRALAGDDSPTGDAAVVVDEAHNLFDRARDYYSPFLGRSLIADVSRRLATGYYRAPGAESSQLWLDSVAPAGERLFAELMALCEELGLEIERALEQARDEGASLVGGCTPIAAPVATWAALAERAARLYIRYAVYNRVHRLVHPRDPLVEMLRAVIAVSRLLRSAEDAMVPFVAAPDAELGAGVGILCVNPADRLARHHQMMAGTVAMSATLSPLPYYADVLGFAALEPVLVAAPSPFPADHRRVLIVPTVSTTYRDRAAHGGAIARLIAEIASARRGRYIAYFPSFGFLAAVAQELPLPPEKVRCQAPDMSELARAQTLRWLAGTPPRLLCAVTGGIFAEGIDLPGDALVGAIVVGPSLPPVGFERTLMRGYFDARTGRGFDYAMRYPGMQRVVQAAGRVIRTMDDIGVIALIGRRFADPRYAACLPRDWYRGEPRELLVWRPGAALAEFWSGIDRAGGAGGAGPPRPEIAPLDS